MNELISKISSYNLFNYLFPGIVFSFFVDSFTHYSLIQENILVGLFLYYFVGLIISRFGSVFVEPFLKWTGFLKFAPYKDFVKASKMDDKIMIFSEQNNMYRTIVSMFVVYYLIVGFEALSLSFPFIANIDQFLVTFFILCLFLISYRKQTKYVKERISINLKQ